MLDANVTIYGIEDKMYATYNKVNSGVPAVVTLSGDYQHNISKNLNVRIEPFLKIPLKHKGVGSLPIIGAGIQLGIMHNLK